MTTFTGLAFCVMACMTLTWRAAKVAVMSEDEDKNAKPVAMSAKEWCSWPITMRRSYVWGVVDTWKNIPGVSRPLNERRRIVMPYKRLAATLGKTVTYDHLYIMVEKYVAEHPAHLNADMTAIIWSAVNKGSTSQ